MVKERVLNRPFAEILRLLLLFGRSQHVINDVCRALGPHRHYIGIPTGPPARVLR